MSIQDPGGGPLGPIFDPGGTTPPITDSSGGGSTPSTSQSARQLGLWWRSQVASADQSFQGWMTRADKVVRRYRDEREFDLGNRKAPRFNILWSNVQVLKPSLYGRKPKPEVRRRYNDADRAARLASTILERAIDYECTQFDDFDFGMQASTEDRLLVGRGTVWVRYEPIEGVDRIKQQGGKDLEIPKVDSAHTPVDYVYWKDFIHSPARTWAEVWWVARYIYLTRDEGVKQFGEQFNSVPLKEYSERADGNSGQDKAYMPSFVPKAKVCEIWNKSTRKICWIAENWDPILKEVEDPWNLEGFWPCPKPLYATMTNGTLVPVPDYCEYQDQAEELDSLTGRISNQVKAIKAVGVYDKSMVELNRLFNEGTDLKMFPVEKWGQFAEKGGLDGSMQLMDLTTQIQALGALYTSREQIKQAIYEICGISDILRGSTKAEETLGAQQLKANFGSLRLKTSQTDVARFASDIFRLKAQLIANPKLYPPEVLLQMSSITETQDGQDPQLVMAALQILADSTVRDFHIAVESDSLAQINEEAEQQAGSEMLAAVGGLMNQAFQAMQLAPEMLPFMGEAIKSTIRRYQAGRQLEAALDQSIQLLSQRLQQQQQNPPPSEAEMEAKAKAQAEQMRLQMDAQIAQQKAQFDLQVQQGKLASEAQLEQQKMRQEIELAKKQHEFDLREIQLTNECDKFKTEIDALTKLAVAEIGANAQAQSDKVKADSQAQSDQVKAASQSESDDKKLQNTRVEKGLPQNNEIKELMDQIKQMAPIVDELKNKPEPKRPRGKKVIRDGENRITAVEDIY